MLLELLLFVLLLLAYAIYQDSKPRGMPPGPTEIPFFGRPLLQTTADFRACRQKYGDIYTVRFGCIRTVLLTKYSQAKELMANLALVDRPNFLKVFRMDTEFEGGLIASNGIQWVHDRRFVLKQLRDLGMGKTYLETAIHEEARDLVAQLKSLKEQPTTEPNCFRTAVLNVVWQMVIGRRYELNSREINEVFKYLTEFREDSLWNMLEGFFPILQKVPLLIKKRMSNVNIIYEFRREIKEIIDPAIEEHQKTLDEDSPRDLVDEYLIEMKRQHSEGLFSRKALFQIIMDLFAAGSETTTNMLKWAVYYMAKYPDIRIRCQQEIDSIVPRDSSVSILNKPDLPYVEAFTIEAFRHSSLIFQNLHRATTKDITIQGYTIPKGTAVTADNYFIHRDPEYWTDPDEFKPDRFIDSTGKFNTKDARFFMFGSGRRQCLGESLARMEFFLFTASLLQNFNIEVPAGATFRDEIEEKLLFRLPVNQLFVYKIRK